MYLIVVHGVLVSCDLMIFCCFVFCVGPVTVRQKRRALERFRLEPAEAPPSPQLVSKNLVYCFLVGIKIE